MITDQQNQHTEMKNISSKILHDMNYLNMEELRSLCEEFNIPYRILYKKNDVLKKTSALERKDVLLTRIVQLVSTGKIPEPTVLVSSVVNFSVLGNELKETDKIYFGQYKHGHKGIAQLVKKLTAGKFKNGALAYDVLRNYWIQGLAPTYKEFAGSWLVAVSEHKKPKAEWAYLTDLAAGDDMTEWKELRIKKAGSVIPFLREIVKAHQ